LADFVNSVDVLGDDAVTDSIIDKSIIEYTDDSVKYIGTMAFAYCSQLMSVDCPAATSINTDAFSECSGLISANFRAVTKISMRGFVGCSSLKTADFHSYVFIDTSAFARCTNLEALILRNTEKVSDLSASTSLSTSAIASGTGYIYVPAALVDSYKAATNWSAFANKFRAIEDWTIDGTVTGELDIENRRMVRFFNDDGTLLGYKVVTVGSDATYTGDDPVKEGEWAFTGWNPVPTNVTADMDCYAQFKSTAPVTKMLIERSIDKYVNDRITSVGDRAFSGCQNIASVDFLSVTSVGAYSFFGCLALESVILRNPSQVTKLTDTNAFGNTPIGTGTGLIFVPAALKDSYESATNWSVYANKNQIRAIEDYPEIVEVNSNG
jgi:hypothetical protein